MIDVNAGIGSYYAQKLSFFINSEFSIEWQSGTGKIVIDFNDKKGVSEVLEKTELILTLMSGCGVNDIEIRLKSSYFISFLCES
jgi:hypothetical protein